MSEHATVTLRDRLLEVILDPENDDPAEWTDDMVIRRVEHLIGEGWYYAGVELERITNLVRDIEQECSATEPSRDRLLALCSRTVGRGN